MLIPVGFSRTVETFIDIDAPPEQVWDVLLDLAAWGEWNPFIPRVEGVIKVGQKLRLTVVPPGRKPVEFPPLPGADLQVSIVRPCEKILWGGGWLGIVFRGDHALLLERLPQGGTRFRQRERFRGLPVLFMGNQFEAIERGYHQMNGALKQRVEDMKLASERSR